MEVLTEIDNTLKSMTRTYNNVLLGMGVSGRFDVVYYSDEELNMENVIKELEFYFNLPSLKDRSRKRELIKARCFFYWILNRSVKKSQKERAKYLGFDRTTLLHAESDFIDLYYIDSDFRYSFHRFLDYLSTKMNTYNLRKEVEKLKIKAVK